MEILLVSCRRNQDHTLDHRDMEQRMDCGDGGCTKRDVPVDTAVRDASLNQGFQRLVQSFGEAVASGGVG